MLFCYSVLQLHLYYKMERAQMYLCIFFLDDANTVED